MKVLAVCGFGLGSSMALKMQIEKAFREVGVSAEFDNTDVSTAPGMNPDVIYTSPQFAKELEGRVKCPVLEITQFMNFAEVLEATKKFLNK